MNHACLIVHEFKFYFVIYVFISHRYGIVKDILSEESIIAPEIPDQCIPIHINLLVILKCILILCIDVRRNIF